MSRLTVVTWNAEGMFVTGTKTRRALPWQAIETLRDLDGDIVVVPEFGRLTDLDPATASAIRGLGYKLVTLAYDEPRTPGLGFAIMSRLPIRESRVHVLAGSKRQLLEVVCRDADGKSLHVFGAHLDDRSEAGRLKEIAVVADIVNRHEDEPVLLAGDFNAMHRDAWFARMMRTRTVRHVSRRIPHALVRSMATRVGEMALGTTIAYLLEHTRLYDLDPGRQRTISARQAGLERVPSWRLAKIDWMFGSEHVRTADYRVLGDVGSDHRPVRAVLEY